MKRPRQIILASVVALGLAGIAAVPAFSDVQNWHGHGHGHHHGMFGARHVEGRIAFLKAELKITDAQMPAFDAMAKVMRDNAAAAEQEHQAIHGMPPKTAVDRLELGAKLADMRAKHLEAFVAVFKPLYDSLSADQQKAADELLGPHVRHG